ncbi:MAG: hypothetical protein WC520_01320 [Candidatus Paceibacterota bacterium]
MPAWLIYGFIASLCWGTDAVMSKIVTSEKYLNVPVTHSSLLMLSGIATAFLFFFLFKTAHLNLTMKLIGLLLLVAIIAYVLISLRQANISITIPVLAFGLLQGLFWGGGMVATFLAFNSGADASRLAPIYNTNTLVSVFLGLAFLHELPAPDQRFKVVSGALLIVVGSILVSN